MDAVNALRSRDGVDLIVLDWMLPDVPGTEICRFIRSQPALAAMPVIMVTARADEVDRVVGLEVGADDYLSKPFSMRELVLRVRNLLRRQRGTEGASDDLTCGPLRADLSAHRVWVGDEEIALTALEFRLLKALLERAGRVQTRERLLEDVWRMHPNVSTRTVDTHVRRLRNKLGASAAQVETLRGVGYRLVEPRGESTG